MLKEAVTTLLTLAWLIAGIWMLCRAHSGNRKQGPCAAIAAEPIFLIVYIIFWPIAVLIDAIAIKVGLIGSEQVYPGGDLSIKIEDPAVLLADAGACGVAVTNLKPSGFVEIDSKRLPASSDGGFIEAGSKVVVREQKGRALVVAVEKS